MRAIATQSASTAGTPSGTRSERLWPYLLYGVFLGFVFTRGEVISWFRIQEMFRFQSFHMYGVIGSAVATGALGAWLIKRLGARAVSGRPMELEPEPLNPPGYQYWLGGTTFGLGWGLLGACPGPIYVLIGNGITVMMAALTAALLGAWTYGALRRHLPHA
jgi:uncharacterized membrane protein YedE/YeeE